MGIDPRTHRTINRRRMTSKAVRAILPDICLGLCIVSVFVIAFGIVGSQWTLVFAGAAALALSSAGLIASLRYPGDDRPCHKDCA